ncbi:vascular cell adhesion protein 1-like [Tachysurus vachellii]|uniref:vascular cell adhesion protein 1-like n=1 Tax=Tachysurus vachellii TaxID=175792 RepID=UPI00296AECCA|nr:vascular cell adhesion protein 1-like [Tachysurus vachellii]
MDWGTDLWIFKFNWTLLYLTQLPGMVLLALQNGDGCTITIQPAKLVVEFGASATANCSTTITHNGMGWEAVTGAVDLTKGVQFLIWRVESLKYWDTQPICYINAHMQCESELPVTVYKRPEKVSISTVDHTGPMIEGKQYKLDCDVQNVAPVNLLTVNWYKGQPGQLVKSVQFNNISSKTPVNRSTELSISTSKEDDGVQYRCEAKLELGPEGPQPPPIKTSDPLSIIVHYGPEIQPVTRSEVVKAGNDLSLSCTAEGNPEPEVSWSFQNQTKATGRRQTILNLSKANSADAGEYLCTASNELGSKTRTVSLTVEESNTRTIIICVGVLLLILIIAYGIYIFVRRR